MITRICVLACAALAVSGCGLRRTRPVSMEMASPEGDWRLEGVQSATLELPGWQIRIVDSKVAVGGPVPALERLVVEIVNTSATAPLVLEPKENTLTGMRKFGRFLGPRERVILDREESRRLVYNPGVRSEPLPYPFSLNITVFRGLNFQDPETVSIKLY